MSNPSKLNYHFNLDGLLLDLKRIVSETRVFS